MSPGSRWPGLGLGTEESQQDPDDDDHRQEDQDHALGQRDQDDRTHDDGGESFPADVFAGLGKCQEQGRHDDPDPQGGRLRRGLIRKPDKANR